VQINDLSISSMHSPICEWIFLDAETWLDGIASGLVFGRMGDNGGYFGLAAQSLLIERHL